MSSEQQPTINRFVIFHGDMEHGKLIDCPFLIVRVRTIQVERPTEVVEGTGTVPPEYDDVTVVDGYAFRVSGITFEEGRRQGEALGDWSWPVRV